MKKIYLLLFLLFSAAGSFEQFNYLAANAQNVSGTYTDLGASGTNITTNFTGTAMTFDDDNSSIQNIGFNFSYNGTVFTQFVLNSNGFIKLGTTAPVAATYDAESSSETNTISPFSLDLDAGASPEYRVSTSGVAGSRICIIQFKSLKDYSATTGQYSDINFQIKLYEGSNNIEFVYGTFTSSGAASAILGSTVGVKGSDASTSVNATKASTTAWASATFINGNYTGNKFNNRNTVLPAPGQTLRFTAVVLPNNDAQVVFVYTLGQLPIRYGSPHIVQALVKNAGGATITNLNVTLNITGANTFTNTKVVTLTPGSSATITFDPFTPTSQGTNNITVSVPSDDVNTNNSSSYTQVVNTNLFSYADNSAAAGGVGYNTGAGLILNKYTVNGNAVITNVNVNISNQPANTGNTVYAVVLNAAGNIIGQSANYVIVAGDLGTYKSFSIPSPPTISNTSFYVGLAQTANTTTGYFPVSYQNEGNPTRAGAYYTAALAGGAPAENATIGRFMIQATTTSVLPVTLTSFDAQHNGAGNDLKWSTSQEINTSIFVVERSADGRTFTQIGQTAASGNSVTIRNYQFTDVLPIKGVNYYRIKIIDRDNYSKYSEVRTVRNNGNTDLVIYPNPVRDVMKIEINSDRSNKAILILTDITGKQVYSQQINVTQGNNLFTINTNNLSKGSYTAKISLSGDYIVRKFSKE